MTWAHCHSCSEELTYPTPHEICDGAILCADCGASNDPRVTVGELISTLIERIEVLEDKRSA